MKGACRCGCGRPARKNGLSHTCDSRWRYWGCPAELPPPAGRGNDRRDRERLEDYAELRSWGESIASAAERLAVSKRTAERYEARLRQQGHPAAGNPWSDEVLARFGPESEPPFL